MKKIKILVICHGNINRSPAVAEMLKVLDEEGVFEVESAGFVGPWKRAVRKTRRALLRRVPKATGIKSHRSKLVTEEMARSADYILYMDGGNFRRLAALVDSDSAVLDKAIPLAAYVNKSRMVDPNFLRAGSEEFEQAIDDLVEATTNFVRRIRL